MRIGLFFGDVGSVDNAVRGAVDAERDGLAAIWYPQIFQLDSLTAMVVAAKETKSIEMGTSVVPVYTHHPHMLAQQALTVQDAAKGRLILGIGLSHQPVVEGMWGMSYEKPARYMREYLSVLLPLLNGKPVSFAGEVFRVNAGVQMAEPRPVPVVIAALAPLMLRMAGEQVDGTVTWMTGVKTIGSHIVPRITEAAKAAGRPAPRIVCALPTAVTDDSGGARQRASQYFQMYGQLVNYRRVLDKEGAEGPADVAVVGNEQEVEQQVRAFAAAGATDFVAAPFPGDDRNSLQRTRELLRGIAGKV
jgi:F420-dependent oxidoreductase-like protein